MKFSSIFKYGIVALSLVFSTTVYAQNARIKIDIDRTIGEIDPLIYGNFMEHLGRCVYGGIYDPSSPLSDEDGLRKDVLEAAKDLNVSIVRYPGGNFVSNYHWLDGVGPIEERKPRMELAWARLETNEFGTNEFMKFIRKLGAEPYFAVNMGTGTIGEAQSWVEYCNVKEGPYYAELRRKHGYPEPYGIKYWSLGNEMDGSWQLGHLNAADYSKKAREAAKLMSATDPSIKLIAAGSSDYGTNADPDGWNRTILYELKDYIDYIALHLYVGNPEDNYYNYMATPLIIEDRTQIVKGMINEVMQKADRGSKPPVYIAWDEYNAWYRSVPSEFYTGGNRALEERYNLEDALVVSGFLNAFVRNADIVKMANMAQLVNVIAPIFVEEDDAFLQTIYFPLQLFANNVSGTSLDIFVDCETYDTPEFFSMVAVEGAPTTKQDAVPYLDVSASYNNGEIIICVVNRHKENAISTDIISQTGIFSGSFEVYEINGPDLKSENNFGSELVKTVEKTKIKANGDQINYSFPPHSFTMLKGKIKE